jgi:hypothetical protein
MIDQRTSYHTLAAWVGIFGLSLIVPAARASSLGFSVFTDSVSGVITGTSPDLLGQHVQINYSSQTGAAVYDPSWTGIVYSAFGSPNVTGLTASFDQTTASAPANGMSSQSSVAADLATGTIHGFVSVVPADFTYGGFVEPSADAEMTDTVTFNIPGATETTMTPISFSYLLDGTFTSGGDSADNVLTSLSFGNAGFEVEWDGSEGPYVTSGTSLAGLTITCFTTTCFGVQSTFYVEGPNPSLFFYLNERFICGGQDNCTEDYSNTGTFGLSLPSGVTYTSNSGVFLTQQASAAPEPATGVFVTLGLCGITWIARRRRRERWTGDLA